MNYNNKKELYKENFSLGAFKSDSVNDKLILVSLVSLVYLKTKEKKPDIKPIDILKQIVHKSEAWATNKMLDSLSILVEELCYDCKIADSCGLKSSKEIINKIKELLGLWMPF